MTTRSCGFALAALCLAAAPALAQQPQRPAVQSPVVESGKVTFAIYAPKNRTLIGGLKAAGLRHEYLETDGAHMWGVWRQYLADFLPRLFRSTAAPSSASK